MVSYDTNDQRPAPGASGCKPCNYAKADDTPGEWAVRLMRQLSAVMAIVEASSPWLTE